MSERQLFNSWFSGFNKGEDLVKRLSKEQLIDLVFDRCNKIAIKNSEEFGERMSNLSKEAQGDGAVMIINFVTAYGNEMRRECCETIAEILYDVLYDEDTKVSK